MTSWKHLTVHLHSQDEEEEKKDGDYPMDKSPGSLTLTTSSLPPTTLPSDVRLSKLFIHLHEPSLFDPLSLASMVTRLRADGEGIVSMYIYSDAAASTSSEKDTSETVLLGFALSGLQVESERKEDGGKIKVLSARLRAHKSSKGAARPLRRKAAVRMRPKNSVKIRIDALGGFGDDGDDDMFDDGLIDENELLSGDLAHELLAPPAEVDLKARGKAQGNPSGGRKACDNCTCGRAEREGKDPGAAPMKSACGNCPKGDAFRCAGCPMLGKPAYREGENNVMLDLSDDL